MCIKTRLMRSLDDAIVTSVDKPYNALCEFIKHALQEHRDDGLMLDRPSASLEPSTRAAIKKYFKTMGLANDGKHEWGRVVKEAKQHVDENVDYVVLAEKIIDEWTHANGRTAGTDYEEFGLRKAVRSHVIGEMGFCRKIDGEKLAKEVYAALDRRAVNYKRVKKELST